MDDMLVPPSVIQMPPLVIKTSSQKPFFLVLFLVLIILIIGGFVVYAYVQEIGPFRKTLYTEENLVSSLLKKSQQINFSAYKLSTSLAVGVRDVDAKPFTVHVSNENVLREQYQNDAQRAQDIRELLGKLRSVPYPAKLEDSLLDPVSGQPYPYQVTDQGNNFSLAVNFETDSAVNQIKQGYNYIATTTPINGQQVVFTKDSYSYLYLPIEPPKPLLMQLGESMRFLPGDVNVTIALGGAADWSKTNGADWRFNFQASGDFSDLTYKVDAEALKTGSDYYFKINNIPSLFLGSMSNIKGQWIKAPTAVSTSTDYQYSSFSYLSSSFPEFKKKYREQRADFVELIKRLATYADEEKLFAFKAVPKKSVIDDRKLYQYDLRLRQEAILPFYKKVIADLANNPKAAKYHSAIDNQGLVDYLQSQEFKDVFNYYNQNASLTLWVDPDGFPAIVEYRMRIVSPDTALQLKDKQANLLLTLTLSDINKPIDISVPAAAKPLQELIDQLSQNSDNPANVSSQSAKLKANLSSIRAQSEILYNATSGYGTKAFSLGACSQKEGTLFADAEIYKSIQEATGGEASKAICVSSISGGKVSAYAVSALLPNSEIYSWCIDSLGASKQIRGSIKGAVCK